MSFFTFKNIDWGDIGSDIFFFGSSFIWVCLMIWIIYDRCSRKSNLLLENIENQELKVSMKSTTPTISSESNYSEL